MKIVQINAVYQYSSTGRTTMEMHKELLRRGIDSYVFCANCLIPEKNVFYIGSFWDHKLHAFCSRIFGLQGYFSYLATCSLLFHLSRIKPNVVILRNLHANYINVPMLFSYLAKYNIAVVNVLHDCWSFTGHCCYYTEDDCQKWQKECKHCSILSKYNKSLFFDNTTRIFQMKKKYFSRMKNLAIIGVSKWITNEAMKSPIFLNAKKIETIYNWINMDIFYPRETSGMRSRLGIDDSDFIVLGVAQTWSKAKGLFNYISLAKQMPQIKFLLVGKMLQNVNLPLNIISIPPTTSMDELAKYYSLADVFLTFSIQETFGKVSAEALSCGTPIIVNNVTANPELCGNGCGFVINDNDERQIMEAILQIQRNGKGSYLIKCRKFAEENFDMAKGIDSYIKLFGELLNIQYEY